MIDSRTAYKEATRRIRADNVPANSRTAWHIICDAFQSDPADTWADMRPIRVQSLLQDNSYPRGTLHHTLARRVLNFPSLVWNYERQRRCANLSSRMRHNGKLRVLDGNYVALRDDDSERAQNEWRARGIAAD